MFTIIEENHHFIVVNKAAGINFHDEKQANSGLHSLVKAWLQQQTASPEIVELYPVHRLDKMTSGLVIFAKTLSCAQVFGEMFSNHQIEKYYLAISDKKPKKKQGLIKGDMDKSRRGMYKLLRTMDNPAITQFLSYALPNKQRLYLLKPHSGKTHQLRVALMSLGAPIVGDPLYNSSSPADRGYLHAYALMFNYLGKQYSYTAQPDSGAYFLSVHLTEQLKSIAQPWFLPWPKLK